MHQTTLYIDIHRWTFDLRTPSVLMYPRGWSHCSRTVKKRKKNIKLLKFIIKLFKIITIRGVSIKGLEARHLSEFP